MNFKDAINILKYHGLLKGIKRIKDEFFETILFDFYFNVKTRKLKLQEEYNDKNFIIGEHKWYQPTYYSPLKKISIYLNKLVQNEKNLIIFDLGTGYGKPLLILNNFIKKNNFLIGVELDKSFEKIFRYNVNKYNENNWFINKKVEEIDYQKTIDKFSLKDFVIIVHNKNSFSKEITKNNLHVWRNLSFKLKKKIYYIYSNPEFSELFTEELIFSTEGWHKNYNINLYKL
tara:strand:+ start:445 stop:1134 length:690 start_codon:yes stop_codon:yes gene_type:complete